MSAWRALLLAAIAALAGACTILPESRPQDVYRLPPSALTAAGTPPTDVSLRITSPSAHDLLAGTRIIVVPEGNRLSVYEGARWSAPAPVLWRDHLLDAFHNDGRITRLSAGAEGLQTKVELGGHLRAFHAEYRDGVPEVVVRVDVRLIDTASRRIMAARRFEVIEPLADASVPVVVEAIGRANDALARELIDWTLDHVAH